MTEPTVEEIPTIRQLRREAFGQDALLFCAAFTAGAFAYFLVEILRQAVSDSRDTDFWSVSLSDNLILCGLLAGELFLVWNNGLRQGLRGHSIGKHRVGIAVVDAKTAAPTGAVRGLLRGLVMVVLLDLLAAAVPIGLPTVLRRLTPDVLHVGGAAYLALLIVVIPLLIPTERGMADRITGTKVIIGEGPDAMTTSERGRIVSAIEILGVLGVLTIAGTYIAFVAQLLTFPPLL